MTRADFRVKRSGTWGRIILADGTKMPKVHSKREAYAQVSNLLTAERMSGNDARLLTDKIDGCTLLDETREEKRKAQKHIEVRSLIPA